MEYGEVRSAVALKRGVGDHAPERFADHELIKELDATKAKHPTGGLMLRWDDGTGRPWPARARC
jgi:hypothetical protein